MVYMVSATLTARFSRYYRLIDLILKARNEGDIDSYIRNVEGLDDLMFSFHDKEYIKDVNNATENYKEKLLRIPNPGSAKDQMLKRQARYNHAQNIFKALMKLISRCGFLPFREFVVIID